MAASFTVAAAIPTTLWADGAHKHEEPAPREAHKDGHSQAKKASSKSKISARKNKQLKAVFPEARSFRAKRYALSKKQASRIQKKLKGRLKKGDKKSRIFKAFGKKKKLLGTVVFVGAKDTDGDSIPAAVGIGLDGRIESVVVFSHHDDNPWAEADWLEQFIGKGPNDDWHPGHTIALIDGYDQPSWQMAKVIRKALLINQAVAGAPGKARKVRARDRGHGNDHAH